MANAPQHCFATPIAQTVHRYFDYVLLLFIAVLAWWLVGLDRRIDLTAEKAQRGLTDISVLITVNHERNTALLERSAALLLRLDGIDRQLGQIDHRLYRLMGARELQ